MKGIIIIIEEIVFIFQNRFPCCSIYQGVKDENGNQVVCTQEYGQHDAHRSAAMVYAPPSDDGTTLGLRVFLSN
jgi:hypothetical protein